MDSMVIAIAIFSIFATILAVYRIASDVTNNKKKSKHLVSINETLLSDYDKIVRRTHHIEHDRQKNKGVHYEETTYLNRAEVIRKHTSFFNFVNQEK